ncbi:pentatricopeptide repeat-containing protein [Dorcoceras hygrometricum]|uniref:Pentatricopeptide repeat-containing protein n=1 Tax=Dorcoceras hygrometricum TaxID=472368 RepID=A0A2Z7C8U4_9LAMI|nr:pentatricopeptide repeat-containing protein [Dorcoceras hygrometricum]
MIFQSLVKNRFVSALQVVNFISKLSYNLRSSYKSNARSDDEVYFFNRLLSISENSNLEQPVKQIHAQVILTSIGSAFLLAKLICVYSTLSLISDAEKVFGSAPVDCFCNPFFWNSALRVNISLLRYKETLKLYGRMRELNIQPDGFGFPLIIRACGMKGDIKLCRNIHCHVISTGFINNVCVSNELLGMYGEIGQMPVAYKLFDRMPIRSYVSWNIMVSGFTKNFDCSGAFEMFCRMEEEGWRPNSVTWTSLLSSFARCSQNDEAWEFFVLMRKEGINATAESIAVVISTCAELNQFNKGESLHGYVITAGFENYVFVRNALISMYGKNGDVENAEYLFLGLKSKSIVSWNALISAYAQAGLCDEAFSAFLRLENLKDDLKLRSNVVTWTAVINGFLSKVRYRESLEIFRQMLFAQVLANAVTVASMLLVCCELSALPLGREIHGHCFRRLMDSDILVTNGLINMYMKCGSLRTGDSLFQKMIYRDINSWNTMITGYGMHGFGRSAQEMFDQMLDSGIQPDEVTFVAVLSAFSHSGLVAEGRALFDRMTRDFQIEPRVEHYACMVDLLGRAGLLKEASDILKSMPMEPNGPVWGALLNACKMHANTNVAEETALQIFNLKSEVTGSYMLLSNLYAATGRWDDSAKVRLSAKTRGLRKIPGQSWIEVNKKSHIFAAGKPLNLEIEELHGVLQDLNLHMVMESCESKGMLRPQAEVEEAHAW